MTVRVDGVDAVLAFGAALVALRLAGELARRRRLAWAGGLLRLRGGGGRPRLGNGARLGLALVPRLLPRGRPAHRSAARRRLAAADRPALGGAGRAASTRASPSGSFWRCRSTGASRPAACRPRASTSAGCRRRVAIGGNSLGTLALVGVALLTIRRRPLGNVLLLAGIAVAAVGSGLAGSSVVTLAVVDRGGGGAAATSASSERFRARRLARRSRRRAACSPRRARPPCTPRPASGS